LEPSWRHEAAALGAGHGGARSWPGGGHDIGGRERGERMLKTDVGAGGNDLLESHGVATRATSHSVLRDQLIPDEQRSSI
jgi:hypothetical protein